jgi:hypothetical protein
MNDGAFWLTLTIIRIIWNLYCFIFDDEWRLGKKMEKNEISIVLYILVTAKYERNFVKTPD